MFRSQEGNIGAESIESLIPTIKLCIESNNNEIKKLGLMCACTIRFVKILFYLLLLKILINKISDNNKKI